MDETSFTLAAYSHDAAPTEIATEARPGNCDDPQEIAALYMACQLGAYRLNTIRTHLAEMYQTAVEA
mgnify:FL=1